MRIVYSEGDSVCVVVPSPKWSGSLEELANKMGISNYEIIPVSSVPNNRTFREAWERGSGTVSVNMEKARGLWMAKIRASRNLKLNELDVAYMRADEENNGQLKAQIAQQKLALRNLPETFDLSSATTPEELKAIWPSEL